MGLRTAKYSDIVSSFKKAIAKEENVFSDGFINWNFVDIDIRTDMSEANVNIPEDYDDMFDYLVKMELKKGREIV